ncbi:hypothetical protein Bca101_083169 [Brassica carinata]
MTTTTKARRLLLEVDCSWVLSEWSSLAAPLRFLSHLRLKPRRFRWTHSGPDHVEEDTSAPSLSYEKWRLMKITWRR